MTRQLQIGVYFRLFFESKLKVFYTVCLVGISILSTPLVALPVLAQSYSIERVPTPSDNITDIAQDSQGFLWMAGAGLHRYDGYTYKTYRHNPADTTSLSSNDVANVLVDRTGVLWIAVEGGEGGLHRYRPEKEAFTRYQYDSVDPQSLPTNNLYTLYEDRAGVIWIGTHEGHLVRFNQQDESFTSFKVPQMEGIVEEVLEDHLGTLWVGTTEGLYTFDRRQDTFTRINFSDDASGPMLPNHVSALYEDREGILWVGSAQDTLFQYDVSTKEAVFHSGSRGKHFALTEDFLEDQRGNLWVVGWEHGLRRFDRDTNTLIFDITISGLVEEMVSDSAYRLFEDRFGMVWVCIIDAMPRDRKVGGLFKITPNPGPFTQYLHDPNDPASLSDNEAVLDVHLDHDGKIWMATFGGGLNVFDPQTGKFEHPLSNMDLSDRGLTGDVTAISRGKGGIWWIGGRSGRLRRYDPESGTITETDFFLDQANAVVNSGIVTLLEDRRGILWIGTWRSGLFKFDLETGDIRQFKSDSENHVGLLDGVVYALNEDQQGQLWVGVLPRSVDARSGVLHRFDHLSNTFEQFSKFGASSVFESRAGALWVGSLSTGLFGWNREADTIVTYSQEKGLAGNQIGCVVEDNNQNLWLSTPAGLSRINPDTEAVYNIPFTAFDHRFAFSNTASSCVLGDDGRIYFGGASGVLSFYPEQFETNSAVPEVVLADFQVDGESVLFGDDVPLSKPIEQSQTITLRYDQNNFSIQFTGLHFEDPARNTYRYKLASFNEDWIDVGEERWARFFNVPPANYTFEVQAANPHGIWNNEGALISVRVLPPWWRTGWAYLLYGIVLVSVFIAGNRIQRQRLIRKEREQARIEMVGLEAAAAAERAEMAEHLEEVKSRFFINLSHELRTPLTLILGPLQDALSGVYGSIGNRLQHPLAVMQRNGDHLLKLINELLEFEKLEAGGLHLQAREQDLVAFARALTHSFSSRAEREQKTIKFDAESSEVLVYFDAAKIEKCIYNLLTNAFKFTAAGDSIVVFVKADKNIAIIKVQDTGSGIPASDVGNVFDRFYQVTDTTTRRSEGVGIGLALAKELIELHQGSIEVESQEGEGSIFTLMLPLGRGHLSAQDLVEVGAASSELHGEQETLSFVVAKDREPVTALDTQQAATILIVEDNVDLREYLKNQLLGYRVLEAEHGRVGLQIATDELPDLIISDVMMPVMDGVAFCKALRKSEKTQDIPIVLLTAKATEEYKIEGLQSGADDYLYKPFSARELMVRIENLIDVRRQLKSKYRSEMVIKPANVAVTSMEAVFVEQVRAIVDQQMGDSWFGVDRLAEEVGLSRRQLQRKMNTLLQTTASTFIRDMRMERATQLLRERAGNVSEVAYAIGYNDVEHFSKIFKKKYGTSPSEFANKMSD